MLKEPFCTLINFLKSPVSRLLKKIKQVQLVAQTFENSKSVEESSSSKFFFVERDL